METIESIKERISNLNTQLESKKATLIDSLNSFGALLITGCKTTAEVDIVTEDIVYIDIELRDATNDFTTLNIDYTRGTIAYRNVTCGTFTSADKLQVAKANLALKIIAYENEVKALLQGFIEDTKSLINALIMAKSDLRHLEEEQRHNRMDEIMQSLQVGDCYFKDSGTYKVYKVIRKISPKRIVVMNRVLDTDFDGNGQHRWFPKQEETLPKDKFVMVVYNGLYVKATLPPELA